MIDSVTSPAELHPSRIPFAGFQNLSANFIYCPNQFFDVCLPHASRGTVRLVAYLLKRTLGWLDKHGNPIEQEICISYRDIIEHAGVSRGAIRDALNEAITRGFIQQMQTGRANSRNAPARRGSFALHWDTAASYTKDPSTFSGFYAGEGYRTPIPNQFFEQVVVNESLAVAKVVGTVLRHTVGYQNQFGGRRAQAPLSYSYIQRYAAIGDRSTLSEALQRALETGYILRIEEGHFDPRRDERKAATYAVRWLTETENVPNGSENQPAMQEQFKNQTKTLVTVQKPDQSRFKIPTSKNSKTRPAEQFKNPTPQKTSSKTLNKQQDVPVAAVDHSTGFGLLRSVGFDEKMARQLSTIATHEEIRRQVEWLDQRKPSQNRLGMLRRAIEEQWAEPALVAAVEARPTHKEQTSARIQETVGEHEAKSARRMERLSIWNALTDEQKNAFYNAALIQATSAYTLSRLRRSADLDIPPTEVLALLDDERGAITPVSPAAA